MFGNKKSLKIYFYLVLGLAKLDAFPWLWDVKSDYLLELDFLKF